MLVSSKGPLGSRLSLWTRVNGDLNREPVLRRAPRATEQGACLRE